MSKIHVLYLEASEAQKIDMLNGTCIQLLAEHAKEEVTHKSYQYNE
jgi:hypothetical protein